MSFYELPIGESPLVGYMEEAYPLSVALSVPRRLEWLYSNYIQLLYQNPLMFENQPIKFYKLSTNSGYVWDAECPILNYDRTTRAFLAEFGVDIVDFICFAIKNGQYPMVYLDEYYLSYRGQYHNRHYVHESLFYGFDKDAGKLKGLAYVTDSEGYSFKSFEADFDEIREAYNEYVYSGELRDKIVLLSLEQEKIYPFNLEAVATGLREYITSYPSEKRYAEISTTNLLSDFKYGLDIYEAFIGYLRQEQIERLVIPFQILAEHKALMCDRYSFMVDNRYIYPDSEVEEGLGEIKRLTANLKLRFVKYQISNNPQVLDKIINSICELKEKEAVVLPRLLSLVEKGYESDKIFSEDGRWFEINKHLERFTSENNEISFKLYLFSEKTMGYMVFSSHGRMVDYADAAKLVIEAPNKNFCIDGIDGMKKIPGIQCVPGEYDVRLFIDFENEKYRCEIKSSTGESGVLETGMKKFDKKFSYIDRVAIVHDYSYRYAVDGLKPEKR